MNSILCSSLYPSSPLFDQTLDKQLQLKNILKALESIKRESHQLGFYQIIVPIQSMNGFTILLKRNYCKKITIENEVTKVKLLENFQEQLGMVLDDFNHLMKNVQKDDPYLWSDINKIKESIHCLTKTFNFYRDKCETVLSSHTVSSTAIGSSFS